MWSCFSPADLPVDGTHAGAAAAGERVRHRADGGGAGQSPLRQVPERQNRRKVRLIHPPSCRRQMVG